MMQIIHLLPALGLGVLTGIVNYSLLWRTIERLPRLTRPGAWLTVSAAMRMVMVLGGLFLVSGSWQTLVSCLLGILGARQLALLRRLSAPV